AAPGVLLRLVVQSVAKVAVPIRLLVQAFVLVQEILDQRIRVQLRHQKAALRSGLPRDGAFRIKALAAFPRR
ncbi:MAG: hypothetical protein ACYDCK_13695, partial [Thermoplasmatota archaeon]